MNNNDMVTKLLKNIYTLLYTTLCPYRALNIAIIVKVRCV